MNSDIITAGLHCTRCGANYSMGTTHSCYGGPRWSPAVGWASHGSQPYRCPVCEGRGTMPGGFYDRLGFAVGTSQVECRSCKGTGIVR